MSDTMSDSSAEEEEPAYEVEKVLDKKVVRFSLPEISKFEIFVGEKQTSVPDQMGGVWGGGQYLGTC